jgi:hypothetical protein
MAAFLADRNDARGGDSYGFFDMENVHKGLGDAGPAIHHVAGAKRFFGHTRKKTTGDVVAENSHPFTIGELVGCHNGMVYNHSELNAKYQRDFAVDSQHIFAHLSEGKDFSELEGYGTICWVDRRKPNRIYLCRMHNGELAVFGIGKDTDVVRGVVWSSNKDHAEKAMTLAGITKDDWFAYKVEEGAIYYVEGGVLYKSDDKPINFTASSRITGRLNQYGWVDDEYFSGSRGYTSHNYGGAGYTTGWRSEASEKLYQKEMQLMKEFKATWADRLAKDEYPSIKEWYDFTQDERNAFADVFDSAEKKLILSSIACEHELGSNPASTTKPGSNKPTSTPITITAQ